jgi:hypothetical protein
MRKLLLVTALLAGCAAQPPAAPVVMKDCSWIVRLAPFTFSSKDTPDTKREIIALHDAYAKNCQ